jgi:hypothetical protein
MCKTYIISHEHVYFACLVTALWGILSCFNAIYEFGFPSTFPHRINVNAQTGAGDAHQAILPFCFLTGL